MPKQKRWTIKRNLDFAAANCESAMINVAKAGHEFEHVHPQYYDAFCALVKILKLGQDGIIALRDQI